MGAIKTEPIDFADVKLEPLGSLERIDIYQSVKHEAIKTEEFRKEELADHSIKHETESVIESIVTGEDKIEESIESVKHEAELNIESIETREVKTEELTEKG